MAKENPPKGGLPSGGYAPISAKRVWMSMRVLRSPSRGLRVLLSRSHDGSPPAGVKFLQVWTADSAACTALSASSKSFFSISGLLFGGGWLHSSTLQFSFRHWRFSPQGTCTEGCTKEVSGLFQRREGKLFGLNSLALILRFGRVSDGWMNLRSIGKRLS